ncbi:MAG: right-handed parallel beta-helix repeat-containing protein [Oscillospiraceae bacterium]|jgi:hypothetical protein|nr:right-handed parallel beta-helix repeat-containing protein [Oscillospiraceae bacterium]
MRIKTKHTIYTLLSLPLLLALATALIYWRFYYICGIWGVPFLLSEIAAALFTGALTLLALLLRGGLEKKAMLWRVSLSTAVFFGIEMTALPSVLYRAMHLTDNLAAACDMVLLVIAIHLSVLLLLAAVWLFGKKRTLCGASVLLGGFAAALFFTYYSIARQSLRDWDIPIPAVTQNEQEYTGMTHADFYVSPQGSDSNDGSAASPFATLEKARAAAAALPQTEKRIALHAGTYPTKGLELTAEDSHTVWAAYGDGEVILSGGTALDPAAFVPVTDQTILERLPAEAQKKVLCLDLGALGFTRADWGEMKAIGAYNTAQSYDGGAYAPKQMKPLTAEPVDDTRTAPMQCELFINGSRAVYARYPNALPLVTHATTDEELRTQFVYTGAVLQDTVRGIGGGEGSQDGMMNPPGDIFQPDTATAARIVKYKTLEDVWAMGWWWFDWADGSSPLKSYTPESNALETEYFSYYGMKEGSPYYIYNALEELDAPGEWYLDRANGIAYVYPPDGFANAKVTLSLATGHLIRIDGGTGITFDGITLEATRETAVSISGDYNTLQNCTLRDIANWAIWINGTGNTVTACDISRTGLGGITIDGGDRETLTPGGNAVTNCRIHDWSEIYQTYCPAVSLNGVGNVCRNNEMWNAPHEAVTWGGNNHEISYNRIHDVCLLSDDAGAIYAGRRWDWYGTQVNYNLLYNLGAGSHRPHGIYLDDALSGITCIGNTVIDGPSCGIFIGGGRDLTVQNNLLIDCVTAIGMDARAREGVVSNGWYKGAVTGGVMWETLQASPWQSQIWQEAFQQYKAYLTDFADTEKPGFPANPAGGDLRGNIAFSNHLSSYGPFRLPNCYNFADDAKRFSKTEGNQTYPLSDMFLRFTDYKAGDYTFKPGMVPEGWQPIPYDRIGVQGA